MKQAVLELVNCYVKMIQNVVEWNGAPMEAVFGGATKVVDETIGLALKESFV